MFRFNRGRLNQQQSEETLRSTLKSGTPNIEQGMSNDEVFLLQYSIFLVGYSLFCWYVNNTGYLPVFFSNIAVPAGAEALYSKIRVKYLIIGGTDTDYPSLEIFSSPNSSMHS